jgi:hypothetical protein
VYQVSTRIPAKANLSHTSDHIKGTNLQKRKKKQRQEIERKRVNEYFANQKPSKHTNHLSKGREGLPLILFLHNPKAVFAIMILEHPEISDHRACSMDVSIAYAASFASYISAVHSFPVD